MSISTTLSPVSTALARSIRSARAAYQHSDDTGRERSTAARDAGQLAAERSLPAGHSAEVTCERVVGFYVWRAACDVDAICDVDCLERLAAAERDGYDVEGCLDAILAAGEDFAHGGDPVGTATRWAAARIQPAAWLEAGVYDPGQIPAGASVEHVVGACQGEPVFATTPWLSDAEEEALRDADGAGDYLGSALVAACACAPTGSCGQVVTALAAVWLLSAGESEEAARASVALLERGGIPSAAELPITRLAEIADLAGEGEAERTEALRAACLLVASERGEHAAVWAAAAEVVRHSGRRQHLRAA